MKHRMTPTPYNEKAAAEMVGVLMLISIFVVVIGVIAVGWFSQPAPQKIPAIAISITNQSKIISISHESGDFVPMNEIAVLVNGMPHEYTCTACGDSWSIGEILTIDYSDHTDFPNRVDIVFKGTSQHLLTSKFLGTQTPTQTPYTTPTSTTTTTTTTTTPVPTAPVANFVGTPTSGIAPLTVKFTDSSTNTPTSWNWSFGDGSLVNATMQNPVHTYASAGNFTVSLNATNSAGSNTFTRTNYITVSSAAIIPIANFVGTPTSGTKPLTVKFTDSSTNTPTSWNWSFGDGSLVNSTVKNPVHTYASAGTFTVSLNATNSAGSNTFTRTNYIKVKKSFADFTIEDNVFVYGSQLSFSGDFVSGPGATVVITDGLNTNDLNGGTSIAVTTIYIDGDVTLNGGSAGLGSASVPGDIYVNGDMTLGNGARNIYGNVYVAGNFDLKDALIHGIVYVNGDLQLGNTPTLDPNARIYYTGTIDVPNNYNHPEIVSKCIHQATVPGFTMPDQTIPPVKSAAWYAARGYTSSGALTSNMKIFADSYSSTSYRPTANNVIIVARNGDITLTGLGGSGVTGVLFAPNGKVTINGGFFEGLVIARDGFVVTSGGTLVTFKNLNVYISNPDDYPF